MKLPNINYNWRVSSLTRRDIMAPQRIAGAQAQAAGAWAGAARSESSAASSEASAARQIGKVYEQWGGYITDAAMQIQQESYETDAQNAYNQSISQINEVENKLYSKASVDMNDPMMEGVNYDDSYEVVDGTEVKTLNSGYAPVKDVGYQVWANQSRGIVDNFGNGLSKGAQKIYYGKIKNQLTSKTQNMGRHVMKLEVADKQGKIDRAITESNRVGDVTGAIRMASEAHDAGYIDRTQMDKYANNSLQQYDLLRMNQALGTTNDEKGLNAISNTALFSNSNLSVAQKAQISNQALAKIRSNRAEARANLEDWRDSNEMNAIIAHYEGKMGKADLIENKNNFGRANFTRVFDRMDKPVQHITDQLVVRSFGEQIINANFINRDPQEIYSEVRYEMKSAVDRGDLAIDDYQKFEDMIAKQEKAPFKRQPYEEVKKSLFVDILGDLDAGTMEEIQNAGLDYAKVLNRKYGRDSEKAVLAIRAFEDLNAYVRQYGINAAPVEWWKDNKQSYKTDDNAIGRTFDSTYPNDLITLSNGQMDKRGTEDNITRNYNNGVYGPPGSREAMMEYSKRAMTLKGVRPEDMMQ